MKRFSSVFLALLLAAPVVLAQQATPPPAPSPQQRAQQPPLGPTEWRIDRSHSAASFSVRHMMISTVRGKLGPITGTIEYDGKDVRSIKADVAVDVNGIDTQNEGRDKHLRSEDFFDVASHPVLTFKSKRVEPGPNGRFKMVGDLTLRGTTKEVVLDVEGPTPAIKDQRGVRVGASATTRINRLEYGLKWNNMIEAGPVVSDEVNITIDLELTRPNLPGTT